MISLLFLGATTFFAVGLCCLGFSWGFFSSTSPPDCGEVGFDWVGHGSGPIVWESLADLGQGTAISCASADYGYGTIEVKASHVETTLAGIFKSAGNVTISQDAEVPGIENLSGPTACAFIGAAPRQFGGQDKRSVDFPDGVDQAKFAADVLTLAHGIFLGWGDGPNMPSGFGYAREIFSRKNTMKPNNAIQRPNTGLQGKRPNVAD